LVTAVAPVVIKGNGLWVGWPGLHLPSDFNDENIPESDPKDQTPTAGLKSDQVRKFLLINSKAFSMKIFEGCDGEL
jgi:trehalose 6-phosphate synthase/phosphatase